MDDTGLVGEIMIPPKPLVMQPRRRAIGGGRDRTPAAAAPYDLGREVVDSHDGADCKLMTRDVGTTYKRALLRQSATERFRRLKAGSIGPDRLHRHVKRKCKMRKVRDFDAERKALKERPKQLRQRTVHKGKE